MDETVFQATSEAVLSNIESVIEQAAEQAGIDIDIDLLPGGILQLSFENDSQIVINRHVATSEIWVAARTGGFHFRLVDGLWISVRDGLELWAALSDLVSSQAGVSLQLSKGNQG